MDRYRAAILQDLNGQNAFRMGKNPFYHDFFIGVDIISCGGSGIKAQHSISPSEKKSKKA